MRAANSYTYTPFGQLYEGQAVETIANPWKFTGQWHDEEIDQYHLRARQYDPTMMRFTSRDPVRGFRENPLTLHKYLYCANDPTNNVDLNGKVAWNLVAPIMTGHAFKNLALEQASYAADSGDWRFFDLAFMTTKFTPYAIGISTTMSFLMPTWKQYTLTVGWSLIDPSGMGFSSLFVDGVTSMVYAGLLAGEMGRSGISFDDYDNFYDWKGGFWGDFGSGWLYSGEIFGPM